MIRVQFIMEQHVGHRSFYENLRPFIDQSSQIEADWQEITYLDDGSFWNRLPLFPESWRGMLIGRSQTRQGLQNHPYDVAFFNTQVPAALGGRVVSKRPYVLSTDVTPIQYDLLAPYYDHKADGDGLFAQVKHRVNVRLFHEAVRILPWSNWTRGSLIEDYGVSSDHIEVLPPGIDTERWRPKDRSDNDNVRILFIGGDLQRKGGELLLEAFRALPADSAELVIVSRSDIPAETNIELYNHMEPNSNELIALSQSCDIFVLPTLAEAFGIAAAEASALGLPVIATEMGGLTDIVVDGETGFLIQPGDKQGLVARMRLLIENAVLRRKLGRAAREHAINTFNAHKNASRIIEILEESANSRIKE